MADSEYPLIASDVLQYGSWFFIRQIYKKKLNSQKKIPQNFNLEGLFYKILFRLKICLFEV
jgi:hypothetical protein